MARFTSDVLKLTGAVGLPDPSPASYNDTKGFWSSDLNSYLMSIDSEFSLTYAGDPNGHVEAKYVGRRLWDTVGHKMWSASSVGNAVTAVWEGVSGSGWSNGAGVPSDGAGTNGMYYLNTTNGDVYVKTSGTWGSPVTNIKGPTGATGAAGATGSAGSTGAAGAAGSVWRNGSGVPSNGTGINGDYYLDTATGDVYLRSGGVYTVVTNIKGPSSTNELALTANNCTMAVSLSNTYSVISFDYTKHRSVPTGHRGIYVGLINGYLGTNQEADGPYAFKGKIGLNINGRWVRGKHVGDGADEATVAKTFGLEWWFFDTYIPPNTDFWTCIRREASDAASAKMTITGISNANPAVVTIGAGHSFLAGQQVRLYGMTIPSLTGSITGATNANPASITATAHGLTTGMWITITGVGGMTQLNTNKYKVTVIDANTFTLATTAGVAINSTAYGTYTSGGTFTRISELDSVNNGGVTYTVANPTSTTFELQGINSTSYAGYTSGGTAERLYSRPYNCVGKIYRGEGGLFYDYATGASIDHSCGVGLPGAVKPATILPTTAAQVNGSGQVTAKTPGNVGSAAVNGVGALYTGGLSVEGYYGGAGVNQPGSLYAGTSGVGGYTFISSGLVSSYSSGGGAGHDPENPPPIFANGGGGFGGSAQALWGPQIICGTPDDPSIGSVLFITDSIGAHGSADTVSDIHGNTGSYTQALSSRLGSMVFGISGESMGGWIQNKTKQLAVLDNCYALGLRIDYAVIALGTNDFGAASTAGMETSIAGGIAGMITTLKAHGISKCITTTVIPHTTGTYTTLAGQTPVTIGGDTLNYQSGGRVAVYNEGIRNGTLIPSQDGFIDLAAVLAAPSPDQHRFRVDSVFPLNGLMTGIAHTGDGIHPNTSAGIPYAARNLNLSALGLKDTPPVEGTSINRSISRPLRRGEVGETIRNTLVLGSAVTFANGTAKTVMYIDVPEGVWKLGGQIDFNMTAASVSDLKTSLSQVDNTLSTTQDSTAHDPYISSSLTAVKSMRFADTPYLHVPKGKITRVYGVGQVSFSGTGVTGYGTLYATRALVLN